MILPSPADKRTVERIGEQLGALKSQITADIKRNVLLRKEVLLVHKQPGFPGACVAWASVRTLDMCQRRALLLCVLHAPPAGCALPPRLPSLSHPSLSHPHAPPFIFLNVCEHT
jgi:hypothetical protein